MKDRSKIIIVIVILASIIAGFYLFKKFKADSIKSSYDYIVVGTGCTSEIFGNYTHTFGIKNGTVKEVSDYFDKDKSNINRIVRSDDMITYFSYDTWYDMYDELGHVDYCSVCTENYNETIKKAHEKYNYNEKDLTIFNKILENVDNKALITYFITTGKNYYIFSYDNSYKVFKYNEENNSLSLLLDLGECSDIDYFYEK